MDGSMFNNMWKGLLFLIVLLCLVSAGCGALIMKCNDAYRVNVTVEKK
jgi:hypothetical protein